jgi:hypothetical protein
VHTETQESCQSGTTGLSCFAFVRAGQILPNRMIGPAIFTEGRGARRFHGPFDLAQTLRGRLASAGMPRGQESFFASRPSIVRHREPLGQ